MQTHFIVFSSLDNEPLTFSHPGDTGVPGIKFTLIAGFLYFSN